MQPLARRLAVALLLSSGPAFAQGETRPAEATGRNVTSITVHDYPDSSFKKGERGMTDASYEVNERGTVTPGSCKVLASSGHAALDKRTCDIIEKRFTFKPALQNGVPVREKKTQSVFWDSRNDGTRDAGTIDSTLVRVLSYYGACLASKSPETAKRLVDVPLNDPQQDVLASQLRRETDICDSHLRSYSNQQLVGAIAEGLFKQRFRDAPLPQLAEGAAPLQPRNGTEAFAHCIARRDPASVRAMLATVPTGPDEIAATAKLIPHLQPCIVAGTTLRLTKPVIRSLVAYALYRDAAHAAHAAGGK